MSSSSVWVQLFYEDKRKGNPAQIYKSDLREGRDWNVASLSELVKDKMAEALTHCTASELFVYPPDIAPPFSQDKALNSWDQIPSNSSGPQPLILVAPDPEQADASGDGQPPRKKIRNLQNSEITAGMVVTLSIDSEKILNPRQVKSIRYFGRPWLRELFEELVDDQTGKQFFNISLVGPPGIGKSNLVYAAAEYIAFKKKKNVLWVGRRVAHEMFVVKLFSADIHNAGNLVEYKTNERSVEKIMQLPTFKDVEVLVLDAPTQANNETVQAGVDAFEWAGKRERESGRRVIHVSSLGSFADKQTIRDQFNLREVKMRLFTRDDYVKSLSDPDLKKQVCDTLGINDPESVTNQDVVDQKFFYSGINARWFYNRSIAEIIDECTEIVQRLDNNVTSTGPKDPRAVNSVLATAGRDGRIIYVYTSCFLAQYIGSSKGSYHNKFLELFPFVAHTLGTGTPGEIFESDFRLHLEQCHNLRDAQIAIMGPDKAEDVMVVLGKHCDGDKSKILCPAGKINILPDPPKDPVAFHRTMLPAANIMKVAQWFIPNSKTQPFLDFMVLIPQSTGKWLLMVIQISVGKTHSADTNQLKRIVGGLLTDGFVLGETITIVYVIEDCDKSGNIAAHLQGSKLEIDKETFELKVVHSVYKRIAAVPK